MSGFFCRGLHLQEPLPSILDEVTVNPLFRESHYDIVKYYQGDKVSKVPFFSLSSKNLSSI